MALDFPVGTDFPGGVIPDGEKYEGFYWDAATGAWKRECNPDKVGDCLDTDNGETVCDRLEILDNQVIELEEEINAIATSLDRGHWEWDFNVSSYLDARLGRGKFYMVRESDLAVTTEYSECGRVVFHEYDMEDDRHTFNDTMLDKVLMLFDRPDDDFLESVITAVQTTSGTQGTAYIVHVNHAQSKGSPTNAPDADGKYKARLNIFDQPTGGNAGEYVKKIGDDMTGELNISTEQDNGDANYTRPTIKEKHLRFSTVRTDTGDVKNAYLFQPGYKDYLMTNSAFISGSNIYCGGSFLGYSSTGGTNFSTHKPRLSFQKTAGGFYYDGYNEGNRRLYMDGSDNYLYHGGNIAAKWNQDGFYAYYQDSERFKTTQFGTYFTQPVYVYHTTIKAQNSAGDSSSGTYGVAGQVLTSQGSNPPRWKDVSGQFGRRFKYSSQTSGTPNQGYFCFHTGRLWINETDLEGIEYRHTIGDYKWDVPFYVFSTSSQHTLMASMLTTGSDYSSAGYTKYISNGWNHTSLTHGATYYCRLTGLW